MWLWQPIISKTSSVQFYNCTSVSDWEGLQNMFKSETIDAYVNCIRQVAMLLGYQEPQILEVFKNTLPTKLYWVLFPIADLRQEVEMAKKNTKEKVDRQLAGQTSLTPLWVLRDKLSKRVMF